MDEKSQDKWLDTSLEILFEAFARDKTLREILIFKGARILKYHLGDLNRFSRDIDSNLSFEFVNTHRLKKEQTDFLEEAFTNALRRYFLSMNTIKYSIRSLKIEANPKEEQHPYGWDGFKIIINLEDALLKSTRGIPKIEIDIAYPEKLSKQSVNTIEYIPGYYLNIYSLERIAGEKPRAFLSTLPAYFKKMGKTPRTVRAKDLYDIAKILEVRKIEDEIFWTTAGNEFKMACESRFIDCSGIDTFSQNLSTTKATYEGDPTIPRDISFDKAWDSLTSIVKFWEERKILPL